MREDEAEAPLLIIVSDLQFLFSYGKKLLHTVAFRRVDELKDDRVSERVGLEKENFGVFFSEKDILFQNEAVTVLGGLGEQEIEEELGELGLILFQL